MKEKFTLEKWLQNKSLKVVDQNGREIPIEQWTLEDLMNPEAVDWELYLVDEEELENPVIKEITKILTYWINCDTQGKVEQESVFKSAKYRAQEILSKAYKALPVWRKAPLRDMTYAPGTWQMHLDSIEHDGYYIKFSELEKLPKE